MRVELIKTKLLDKNTWNPNEMDNQQFVALIENIKKNGVLQPILVREDYTIIKGEKRWLAAKKAGLEEIYCVVVETSEEESKLLTVGLNKLRGQTNEEMLNALLGELTEHFSMDEISVQTGFQIEELEDIVYALPSDTDVEESVEDDGFNVEETIQDIEEPETNYGDVWQLGNHILMCGDSTDFQQVQELMSNGKAQLVVTDPPYNVAVKSESEKLSSDGQGSILNDDMDDDQFDLFLRKIFQNYRAIMEDKAGIYVFHASSYQRAFENEMNTADIEVRTQCIWVKNSPTFGWAQYRFKHEPVFYAHIKSKSPYWFGDRKQTTVWKAGLEEEIPLPESVWEVSRGNVHDYIHPTQKPLELIAIPVGNSSKKGDVIVDLFGGSGSTLMTCEQMGRSSRIMELDPYFCDAIKKRYESYTGEKPKLLKNLEEE